MTARPLGSSGIATPSCVRVRLLTPTLSVAFTMTVTGEPMFVGLLLSCRVTRGACVSDATLIVNDWLATPPRPSLTVTCTGALPRSASVGDQVMRPSASMVMPAGAVASDISQNVAVDVRGVYVVVSRSSRRSPLSAATT